ncbi:MAG: hypothetical protein WC135_01440 [Bacteroidales bacterium]
MKKIIFSLVLTVFFGTTTLVSCMSPGEKVDSAKEDVQEAKQDVEQTNQELNNAIQDSIMEFRKDAAERINANEKEISDLKLKLKNQGKEAKAKIERKIAELEAKNNKMEEALSDYKDESEIKWKEFKEEFNHDLDELGKALGNLSTNNL